MKPDVVVIGNATLDDTILPDGTTHMAVPGGSGIYSALSGNLWADLVALVTRIGKGFPNQVRRGFEQAGILLDGWREVEEETLRTWVLYDDLETRRYISRHSKAAAIPLMSRDTFDAYQKIVLQHNLDLSPGPEDIPEMYQSAKIFHIAPMAPKCQLEVLKALSKAGTTSIMLDPHFELVSGSEQSTLEEILSIIKIFLPSEEELNAIFGPFREDQLKKLADLGPEVVGVKRGEKGVGLYSREKNKIYQIPVFPTDVVDPTGAGDAFCAGMAAAISGGASLPEAAACGTASASMMIEGFGGLHLLNADKQEAVLRKAWVLERIT